MIAAPWIISIAISSPIVLGLNTNERLPDTPTMCTFYNPDLLIYSSMGSFYIPSIVMPVLFGRIYLVIRYRPRAGSGCGASSSATTMRPTPSQWTSAWRPSAWSRAVVLDDSGSVNVAAAAAFSRYAGSQATTAAVVGLSANLLAPRTSTDARTM